MNKNYFLPKNKTHMNKAFIFWCFAGLAASCSQPGAHRIPPAQPKYITDSVSADSDDPAIWIHPTDPAQSLILGTDKQEGTGGLYAFSLTGKMDTARSFFPLDRPNNVDVAYGFVFGPDTIDIAVCTERGLGQIRVFRLPALTPIDGGGLKVFEDDTANNKVMGVALYRRPADSTLFAIVSRKEGAGLNNDYLYQYRLFADSTGLRHELVRKFGAFSGQKEIEAVAVDAALGYVYYSDESYGIHKYHADPDKGNAELAVFGLTGFTDDREGISIYPTGPGTGYLLVSDQGAHQFRVFRREGSPTNPHEHVEIGVIRTTALSSDGSEVTATPLGPDFPKGLFVAMSDNRTFELFDWRDLEQQFLSPEKP